MTYQPRPVDTSQVELPEELHALLEMLAANTHEQWAKQRMAEGWVYGPARNDARKEHPDLVPYEQLTEAEKAYDRTSALEALKVIVARGYRIVPPGSMS
jgi:hypothetical protein